MGDMRPKGMKKIKAYTVITLFIISVLVFACCFVTSVTDYDWPFKRKRRPQEKETTAREAPEKEIPLDLVQEIVSQQRESSYNLRQLALGGIEHISIHEVLEKPEEVEVEITAHYVDNSTLDGFATFWKRDSDWYLVEVTRESRYPDPPLRTRTAQLTHSDLEIGREIVRQQRKNQQVPIDFIEGKIKDLAVNKVTNEIDREGRDQSNVDISTTYQDGQIEQIIAQMIHHEGFWYLITIERK